MDLSLLVCTHSWPSFEMGRLVWMSTINGDYLMHQDLIRMHGIIKVVEILGLELVWILAMEFLHLLLECQTVRNVLHLLIVIGVWLSGALAILVVYVVILVRMAQFQAYLVLILPAVLVLLLWRNAVWAPLTALLVSLCSFFGLHFLCDKAVFDNLVDVLLLVIEVLLNFITLLNESDWIRWILGRLL